MCGPPSQLSACLPLKPAMVRLHAAVRSRLRSGDLLQPRGGGCVSRRWCPAGIDVGAVSDIFRESLGEATTHHLLESPVIASTSRATARVTVIRAVFADRLSRSSAIWS